jgi:hypothetical protein
MSSSAHAPRDNVRLEKVYGDGKEILDGSLLSFQAAATELASAEEYDQKKVSAAVQDVEDLNTFIPLWNSEFGRGPSVTLLPLRCRPADTQ